MSSKVIGHVAVDSGQIMIIDPCYINADFANEFDPGQLGEFDDTPTQDSYDMNYDGCCNATLSKEGYGTLANDLGIDLAFASRTLHGDGVYPVTAELDYDGRVKSITIDFDPVPESETCYNCGEDLYTGYCECDDENYNEEENE